MTRISLLKSTTSPVPAYDAAEGERHHLRSDQVHHHHITQHMQHISSLRTSSLDHSQRKLDEHADAQIHILYNHQ